MSFKNAATKITLQCNLYQDNYVHKKGSNITEKNLEHITFHNIHTISFLFSPLDIYFLNNNKRKDLYFRTNNSNGKIVIEKDKKSFL